MSRLVIIGYAHEPMTIVEGEVGTEIFSTDKLGGGSVPGWIPTNVTVRKHELVVLCGNSTIAPVASPNRAVIVNSHGEVVQDTLGLTDRKNWLPAALGFAAGYIAKGMNHETT